MAHPLGDHVTTTVAAAAGHFGPDVTFNLHRIEAIVREAAGLGADLLVLPHGVLSGYHDHLGGEYGEVRLPRLKEGETHGEVILRLAASKVSLLKLEGEYRVLPAPPANSVFRQPLWNQGSER